MAGALRPRSAAAWAVGALIVVGAALGTGLATQRAVAERAASMPTAPSCTGGDPGEAAEAGKASAARQFEAETARFRQVFAEMPSPGHFGEGSVSTTSCVGNLVDVPVADAYEFYETQLPEHGWTITERARGEWLEATRDDLTLVLGDYVDVHGASVEVRDRPLMLGRPRWPPWSG